MNTHLFATVIFGLAASLCWGSGDFSGGLASRRAFVGSVVLTDYLVGFVLLITLALIWQEPFPAPLDVLCPRDTQRDESKQTIRGTTTFS